MALFSERYGYTKPSDVIIREEITPEIQNAICNCYDDFNNSLDKSYGYKNPFAYMEKHLWIHFSNKRNSGFDWRYKTVATEFIENVGKIWYEKLNLIEFSIKCLYSYSAANKYLDLCKDIDNFVSKLNYEFKRLNFAYRIIDKQIAEITTEEEIVAIEEALSSSKNNIRIHLNKALELYAQKPTGDYRNSIKESISAVEAFCRERTEENTLGKALNNLESSGIIMPKILKTAFDKLYAYTNHPDTGIRHALMDDDGSYVPQAEEALFILVSCSAFINYLNKKVRQ